MSDTITMRRRGYIFDWAGGPYIEVARADDPEHPFDVINVTDTEEPFTRVGLAKLVNEWQGSFPTPGQAFTHLKHTAHNVLDY